MLTLADVIEALTNTRPAGYEKVIADVAINSRECVPGALFIAMPGQRVDGHDYVSEAFKRGADFAIVQKDLPLDIPLVDLRQDVPIDNNLDFNTPLLIRVDNSLTALQGVARFWRSKLDLRVVAITGSVGKSTTKEVVASVLKQKFITLKNIGNLNNEIGLPLTILGLTEDHDYAVLEMGLYVPGEIEFLCDLAKPHVGVVTNVGTVHAERAGSQEAIAQGKSELVQALPPEPDGVAILNYDDPWVRDMAKNTKAKIFYYGLDSNADLWADQVEGLGLEGIRFCLHYGKEKLFLKVPLIGRHSVHTVLRAVAVGLVENLTWQEIITGLRTEHEQLRLVAVRAKNDALLLDDTYNASPQSVMAALNLLDELKGHKIAVLGDMLELGPYEKSGHQKIGLRAAEVADKLIAVGELGNIVAEAARSAGLSDNQVMTFDNVDQAIVYLQEHLQTDDIVLIKGSHSMRMDRIVATLEVRE
ncbi:MAG: UDP-N-acetylmuramoyl-tripeptide--D-alanyl-D-alanine ligase [Anaerolineae bacterium]|nr:UDP-N-acetylmuramoyl-tripeptide--D-alanyl-D-alanine ligase [Anaerolineae bacterium]